MTTPYPFRLAEELGDRLPAPRTDGLRDIDVKVHGAWDGILVVDAERRCIGIRVRRRVEAWPLPFDPAQIEDVRPACLWNRVLAQIPFDLYDASLVTVLIASPVLLVLSKMVFSPLSLAAAVACVLSIYFMYQVHGSPFIRLLAALAGLAQAVVGIAWFVRWVSA
ncbi:MAG: hypothetical protein K8T90_07685 [Planctomycetes bacterium]|nr:hypothetical protein [Planctomycetota bacterium]